MIHRAARYLGIACLGALLGCGGGTVKPTWHDAPRMSETTEGLILALDIGLDEYLSGQPLDVKVGIKNALLKPRVVDLSGNWAKCRFVIKGPDGIVEPVEKEASSGSRFRKLGPGEHLTRTSKGPSTAEWKYEPIRQPGEYTIKAVYEVELSDEWNRLSVAGGPYEGQVLWTGKVETPEIEFSVYLPEGARTAEKTQETQEKPSDESAENPTKKDEK